MRSDSETRLEIPDIGQVSFRKSAVARRVSIRVHPLKGVTVTMPSRLPVEEGLRFLMLKKKWVHDAMRRQGGPDAWRRLCREDPAFGDSVHRRRGGRADHRAEVRRGGRQAHRASLPQPRKAARKKGSPLSAVTDFRAGDGSGPVGCVRACGSCSRRSGAAAGCPRAHTQGRGGVAAPGTARLSRGKIRVQVWESDREAQCLQLGQLLFQRESESQSQSRPSVRASVRLCPASRAVASAASRPRAPVSRPAGAPLRRQHCPPLGSRRPCGRRTPEVGESQPFGEAVQPCARKGDQEIPSRVTESLRTLLRNLRK